MRLIGRLRRRLLGDEFEIKLPLNQRLRVRRRAVSGGDGGVDKGVLGVAGRDKPSMPPAPFVNYSRPTRLGLPVCRR